MRKSDQATMLEQVLPENFQYIDYDKQFHNLVLDYIIKPFGGQGTLNQDLVELFTQRLDLSEALIKELKASAEGCGRKTQRKP